MKTVLAVIAAAAAVYAQSLGFTLTTDKSSAAPGDTFTAALTIAIPDGYHLYGNPLGPGVGKPLTVSAAHTDKITWLDGFSDAPVKFEQDSENWVWQWDDSVHIFLRGTAAPGTSGTVAFSITADGLICKTACIPQNKTVSGTITIGKSGETHFPASLKAARQSAVPFPITKTGTAVKISSSAELKPFVQPKIPAVLTAAKDSVPAENSDTLKSPDSLRSRTDSAVTAADTGWNYRSREASSVLNGTESRPMTLIWAVVLALAAGFILNFMPCVLPVLGIKVLAFSKGLDGTKAEAVKNSLAFSAGMILVFMLLAALAAFAGMSWGEQFQNPAFISAMIALMFLFGLGMFDLFIILVPSKIAEMDQKQDSRSLTGNFAKGVFAAILATPCSGPFLGAALAWTVTQSKPTIFAVFLALGIGMASPYVLLSASRRLSRLIPKPGAWMEDFKHILGFCLFGFAVYLMIGLPQDMVVPTVSFITFLAAAVILYTRIAPFGSSPAKKTIAVLLTAALLGTGFHLSFTTVHRAVTDTEPAGWKPFSGELLQEAHKNRQMVLVDFTAVWCMNCQFNKKSVYHTEAMDSVIALKNILPMTADLTVKNEELESLRSKLGSESIPFLVLFPADDPSHPIVFRDIVSRDQLFKVIDAVSKR